MYHTRWYRKQNEKEMQKCFTYFEGYIVWCSQPNDVFENTHAMNDLALRVDAYKPV